MTNKNFAVLTLKQEINYIQNRIDKLKKRKEQTPLTSKGKQMISLINFTIKQAKENINSLNLKIKSYQ